MTSQDIIREMFHAAHGRWPGVELSFDDFAARCNQILALEGELPLESAAVFLCCACAAGQRVALRSFENEGAGVAQTAIKRIDRSDEFVRDALQELWPKLLVGADAGVRSYTGRGPLQAWVRVAATRVAIDRKRSGNLNQKRHVELSERLAAADLDLEASLLRARFGRAFQDALHASLAALSKQDRNVLRLHAVGHCNIDEIGRAYNVHRATAARWIERCRAKIYAEVRQALQLRHGLTPSEFKSLAVLIGAELELSLSVGPGSAQLRAARRKIEASGC